MAQKILEIKNLDWLKGISAQPNVAMGGLFQSFIGCDPFEQGGLALPSLAPDTKVLSTVPKFLTSFNNGGTSYIYAHTPTKLYQLLRDSPYTVTDVTSQINQHLSYGNPIKVAGRVIWKGMYVYSTFTDGGSAYFISATSLPVNSGNDVLLNAVAYTAYFNGTSGDYFMPLCVGADGNCYYGDVDLVGVLTNATGSSGNSTTHGIDPGYVIRDIVNDGRYLVIFADNNALQNKDRVVGEYTCKVYFWDMVQTDGNGRIICDAIWTFSDSYIIGAKLVDGNAIEMMTYNGINVTNVATQPKMIRPFPTSNQTKIGRPLNPEQIKYAKGSLYWLDGSINTNSYIYAHGNPITGQPKIFYVPYSTQGVNGISQCLLISGNTFVMGNDNPILNFFNVGTTRGGLSVTTLDTNMEQPFTYGYIKVVLGQKLAAGQQVQVVVYGNGGNDLISSETQVYSGGGGTVVGAKQTLLFKPVRTSTNQPSQFEDITVTVVANGASLQRVSAYATPLDDANVAL